MTYGVKNFESVLPNTCHIAKVVTFKFQSPIQCRMRSVEADSIILKGVIRSQVQNAHES